MTQSDQELLAALAEGDKKVFENLFHQYYTALCRFSLRHVGSQEVAEEMVQEVFLYIWDKRATLNITTSLKAYLYTAVRNQSINRVKSEQSKMMVHSAYSSDRLENQLSAENELDLPVLQKIVAQGIESLPNRCRAIFNLSRNAGMTYAEIAQELNISVKTVEAQMGIALKKLKVHLSNHWDKIITIIVGIWPYC